jgi:hypothetical protein
MGEGNEVEFGTALQERRDYGSYSRPGVWRWSQPGQRGLCTLCTASKPPDKEVFTGALAEHLPESISLALRDAFDGWIDDDLAFTSPGVSP